MGNPAQTPPGWLELTFEAGPSQAEPWSEALLALGALSVLAEDADAESADEQPLYAEPGMTEAGQMQSWRRTQLSVLLPADTDANAFMTAAAASMAQSPPTILALRSVLDQDWVRLTQAQFEPMAIGQRLWITPSWLPAPPAPRLCVILDPGLAFGTGSHPTTQLCLQWLEQHLPPAASLIDYGCGSGILAIAAAKLGASPVTAIDIDPQACAATEANAARNHVTLQVCGASDPPPSPAHVVVANILSSPLKLLAPLLTDLVQPGGQLILSGVLERQVAEVCAAYAPRLPLSMVQAQDGWACLVGTRPA